MPIVLFLIIVILGAISVVVFGVKHEHLARALAWIFGRRILSRTMDDVAGKRWHPYYWRAFTWFFIILATPAALYVAFDEPEIACTHVDGGMRCRLDWQGYAITAFADRSEALRPVVTGVGTRGDQLVLLDHDNAIVAIVHPREYGLTTLTQKKAFERVISGQDGAIARVPVDERTAFVARFPWILFVLLAPHVAASLVLVFRSPRIADLDAAAARAEDAARADDERGRERMYAAPIVAANVDAPVLGCCPRGHGALAKGKGVLLEDVCPTCSGRALGSDAVQRVLVDELGLSLDMLRELASQFGGPRIDCPSCATKMSPVTLKGVRSDLCFGCGALWLDAGELARLTSGRYDEVTVAAV